MQKKKKELYTYVCGAQLPTGMITPEFSLVDRWSVAFYVGRLRAIVDNSEFFFR